MADPLSAVALTGVALAEGIKFLYNQADGILKRRAERKEAERVGTAPPTEPILVETPEIVAGQLAPISVDASAADALADELKELRRKLEDYAQGYETPSNGDPEVLRTTLALRDAIEDIVGQRITFKGEDRESSGTPVVTGKISAKEIRGRATAVEHDDCPDAMAPPDRVKRRICEDTKPAGARCRSRTAQGRSDRQPEELLVESSCRPGRSPVRRAARAPPRQGTPQRPADPVHPPDAGERAERDSALDDKPALPDGERPRPVIEGVARRGRRGVQARSARAETPTAPRRRPARSSRLAPHTGGTIATAARTSMA